MSVMKPADDAVITAKNIAGLHGGEGVPLSKLAAGNERQRALNFRFEAEDKALVKAALSSLDDPRHSRAS